MRDSGTGEGRLGAGDILDGRYQLLRDLGQGAAGIVFEARHLFTGRSVAVKIVVPSAESGDVPALRARLQREGRALASVRHPGVVDVLDGGIAPDGTPYLVMEMLEGRTLEGLLAARTRLSIQNTVAVALQLCDALAAAHRVGIVHRDVKPGNIIVLRDADGHERVKLLDFGIAKINKPGEAKLTGSGALIGTPAYMSPEQLLALDDVDHLSDVYAVGVTMFECLSGTMPYRGNYPQVLLDATGDQPPPSLRSVATHVPEALVLVVDQALAKPRMSRFGSAQELAAAIEAAVSGAERRTTLLGPPPLPPRDRGRALAEDPRRRAERAPYNTPVRIVFPGGASDGRTEDISEGGLLVLSRAECIADQHVAVRFALPVEGKVASVEAVVRWVRARRPSDGPGGRAIGLEFVDLPPSVRASIAQYVSLMADRNQA